MIYADHAATTKLSDTAFQAMLPWLKEEYGNPSQPYSFSRKPKKAVSEAREIIASCIHAKPEEIYFGIGGKNGQKAKKSFEDIIRNISLVDIIKSCNFRFCGPKVAEQCATYLITGDADFEHLAEKGYLWCTDNQSEELDFVYQLIHNLGKTFKDFEQQHEIKVQEKSNQIPIIMTGEPNGYNSKGHFLQCHPEYRQTGSWKEVQIVFTNSFESNTGKMKKAREKGIKIELY